MQSNTLSTPWTPTLNGQLCPSYVPYTEVVAEKAEPNFMEDVDWARRNLDAELERTPDDAEALWEGVLALWRLKLVEEEGKLHSSWRGLVSAWLHRHGNICTYLEIAPLKVVWNYAIGLRDAQILSTDMIPRWDGFVPTHQPVVSSGPEPAPEPTPKPAAKQRRKRNAAMVPSSNYPPVENADFPMVESVGSPVATSTRKGKERARPDASPNLSDSQQTPSDVAKTGSKRLLTESTAVRQSKRLRGPPKQRRTEQGLDFGTQTFPDGSEVSSKFVPTLNGMVCDFCKSKKKQCEPIWLQVGKLATIGCVRCSRRERNCSFKDRDWDIDVWPHLEVAKGSQSQREKRQRRLPTPTEGVAGPSNVNRERFAPKDSSARTNPPKPKTIATSVTGSDSPATPTRGGKTHSVLLQDLRPFQKIAVDENATRTALKMHSLELRSIGIRESAEAEALRFHIDGRAKVIQQLATLLSDAGTDDEEDALEQEEIESNGGENDNE